MMVIITVRVRTLLYVKRDVKRKRGLGSWVIAHICCLTPDTKAERGFITHRKKKR